MGKPKLNPCPFCGHAGEMWRNKDKGSSGRITSYVVRCTNPVCIAHTITARRYALEVAEAAWNHRAEAARPLYGCNVCAAVRDITARMRAGVIPPHRRDEELLAYLADRIEEALGCMGGARVVEQEED